ncbi:MAG: transposase [SAR86 cluster bacterium]|uniref:Transposase n=1 Tax=SAR86 cluster bacterium TaxID=2030880 RepID=A0A2A4X386_9GAMM|nr:MAG: transposase [SAR86 cluster bacterium]
MPRIGRLHIPGGYYHLMGRGLERRNIFREEVDKYDFLERFGKALDRNEMQCFAWALMSNHYHLLVRVHDKPLSKLMASVLGGYASAYNRRNRRVGYVFQNRYKSILCDADDYLLELIRYIHLNPLRAGMLPDLDALGRYKWTGHAGVLGRHKQKWHKVDAVLGLFGHKIGIARRTYSCFISEGIDRTQREDFGGGGLIRSHGGWESLAGFRKEHQFCIGDERILGGSDFVEKALGHDKLAVTGKTSLEQRGWTLEKLIQRLSDNFGVSEAMLLSKARSNDLSVVKSLISYWGTQEIGLSCREIALRLNISQQAVSSWVVKGEAYCEREKLVFEEELRLSC